MREYRLKAYEIFKQKPRSEMGAAISLVSTTTTSTTTSKPPTASSGVGTMFPTTSRKPLIDSASRKRNENSSPASVPNTIQRLSITTSKKSWRRLAVIFVDTDTAIREYPDLVKKYFGTVIPSADNKLAALNSAVWSGGSFIYVPARREGRLSVASVFPHQQREHGASFERTLIIADEGAEVHYVEGCTAPTFSSESLHSAVVEIICKKGSRCALHHYPKLGE